MNLAALQQWFDKLAPRERWMVMAGAVFALVALIFALGIRPLYQARDAAAGRVADQRRLLADIEQVAQRFGPQSGPAAQVQGSGESVVVLVDRAPERAADAADMEAMLCEAMKTLSVKDAAAMVAEALKVPKREVYQAALRLPRDG